MLKSTKKIILLISLLIAVGACQNTKVQNKDISKPKFVTSFYEPVKITKLDEGHYFIDFGLAFFGTLSLKSNIPQQDSLIIHLAEELSRENVINRNPKGTIRYQKTILPNLPGGIQTDIILSPNKRNSTPPAILLPDSIGVVMPFRYCEIENLKIPIDELIISQKAVHYLFNDDASMFTSSDTILNQVWDLCKHTIKAMSFTGYYIDGDRERIPYEADAYINQLSHYAVDSEYSIARRTNEYFIDHATWPTEWLLHTVMLFYQDYMYTGDVSSIEEYYDVLKHKTLQDLAREDGLISSTSDSLTSEMKILLGFKNHETQMKDIVDWPPGRKETGWKWAPEIGERDGYDMVEINTVVNSFFYHNMVLMSEIALALGKSTDAKTFNEKAKQVKESVNTKLFDKSLGIYIDGEDSEHSSLHANMFPLAFGLVPEENIETVVDYIKTKGMACSVYGAQYLLEGLYNVNESEYALHLITDTTNNRTWWNMIQSGSTMTLEAWDIEYKPNLDWNHAWGTAPANIISRHIWGVTPQNPGFKYVQVKPQMASLSGSEIKIPTINGSIYARYIKTENNIAVFEIELPPRTEGEFVLPKNYDEVLQSNELELSGGTVKLKAGKNVIKLTWIIHEN